jgi:hypothetical protein
MPFNTNDQNYHTKNSRVLSFNDFEENINKEKEDLEKVKRSYVNNHEDTHSIPGNRKFKFNRVTRKMDDLSKDEVKDKLDNIDVEEKKHKYKIVEENAEVSNYMFFSNLKSVKNMVDDLMNLDEVQVDSMLNDHDWAEEHMSTAKDDIEEVYNFFKNKTTNENLDNGEDYEISSISENEMILLRKFALYVTSMEYDRASEETQKELAEELLNRFLEENN